jgi:hypothetical protein
MATIDTVHGRKLPSLPSLLAGISISRFYGGNYSFHDRSIFILYLNLLTLIVGYMVLTFMYSHKVLCQEMHAECAFTNQAFDRPTPGLKFRRFDLVMVSVDTIPEREKQVLFTRPCTLAPRRYLSP